MKLRNLNAEMLNEKGEPYTDRVTVRKILIDAAGATVQAGYPGINEKPGDKYTLGLLAVKLFRAKATVQIESGEVTLLKARIAALCLRHGVKKLLSADRDFGRFPGLKIANPLLYGEPH